MKALALVVLAASCAPHLTIPDTGPRPAGTIANRAAASVPPGPATVTVQLEGGVITPVVEGPFEIHAINPGGRLELAVADSCSRELTWFSYSGGGVAVGADQVLCARLAGGDAVTNGFSGVAGARPARPVPEPPPPPPEGIDPFAHPH